MATCGPCPPFYHILGTHDPGIFSPIFQAMVIGGGYRLSLDMQERASMCLGLRVLMVPDRAGVGGEGGNSLKFLCGTLRNVGTLTLSLTSQPWALWRNFKAGCQRWWWEQGYLVTRVWVASWMRWGGRNLSHVAQGFSVPLASESQFAFHNPVSVTWWEEELGTLKSHASRWQPDSAYRVCVAAEWGQETLGCFGRT